MTYIWEKCVRFLHLKIIIARPRFYELSKNLVNLALRRPIFRSIESLLTRRSRRLRLPPSFWGSAVSAAELTRWPRGAPTTYPTHCRPTTRDSGGATIASPHRWAAAHRRVMTAPQEPSLKVRSMELTGNLAPAIQPEPLTQSPATPPPLASPPATPSPPHSVTLRRRPRNHLARGAPDR